MFVLSRLLRAVAPSDGAAAGSQSMTIRPQAGFTLLELLAVIALMAVVAGTAVLAYDGVQDQGRQDATRFEMAEVRKALLQFRRDSGSNDLPGQGAYDCEELADEAIANGRPATWPAAPAVPVVNNTNKADWITWCQHPANFWMLFVDPLGGGWNPDTHRGWNGPYLQRKSGLLSYAGIDNLSVIIDAYQAPYLMLDLNDAVRARLLSIGPDRTDNNPSPSSCQIASTGDDTLLCLLR